MLFPSNVPPDFSTVIVVQSQSGVYRMDDQTDGPMAIKGIKESDPNGKAVFVAEVEALSRIKDPITFSLPKIIASKECPNPASVNGFKYLIAETYIKACPLQNLFHEHPKLSIIFIQSVLAQVARTLSHVHSCGVVHRDLKLPNVMVAESGRVHLVDFGHSATVAEKPTSPPSLTAVTGTVHLRAPEMLTANDKAPYGGSVDLWGLGMLGVELLLGRPPMGFDATAGSLSQKEVDERVCARLWTERSDAAGPLLSFIQDLLKVNPAERLGCRSPQSPGVAVTGVDWDAVLGHPTLGELTGNAEAWASAVIPYAEEIEMQTLGM